ncbi:MAG: hypothetical protein MJK04_14470 [Psychrosphaera sp.]|nr:hypothetical protein [Psychrosphaera sp.]
MKTIKILGLLLVVFLAGCSSRPNLSEDVFKELKYHQLYVDEKGRLLDPDNASVVDEDDESAYVDAIFTNFEKVRAEKAKEEKQLQLTIYIHGGLNKFDHAVNKLVEVKQQMLDDNKYPLFVSWNSGAFTNYFDHLLFLRRGKLEPILGPLSSPFVFLEDAFRAIARIPASTYNIIFGQNSAFIELSTEAKGAAAEALSTLEGNKLFKIHDISKDNGYEAGDLWSIWNPVKLVTAPFLDGLGKGAWDSMLHRTDLVLRTENAIDGNGEKFAATAVTDFFEKFTIKYGKKGLSEVPESVTIIGHSMGAIISNNIIARYQNINFDKIVYMAAACRMKDIERVVTPYLNANPATHFYNLSLSPEQDILENFAYDFIPRGSLLMWIDSMFGDMNSFQDRTAGFWYNSVRTAHDVFKHLEGKERVHLTKFGINDDSPQKQGEFDDNYNFWRQSFWEGNIEPFIESVDEK